MSGWKGLPAYALHEWGVRQRDNLVEVPYRDELGVEQGVRVIARSGRRWWQPEGLTVIPLGLDQLEDGLLRQYRVLVICEGESDTIAVSAALGHEGVDVLGVPGAHAWKPEWAQYANGYAAVYVVGDGDDAGRAFNERVQRDLPHVRIVSVPRGSDVRELIQSQGVDALLERLAAADREADFNARLRAAFARETIDAAEALLSPPQRWANQNGIRRHAA